MAERFTERLRQKAAGVWEAQHQHPFVRGIGDGTLSLERFKFWLRQDYVFLIVSRSGQRAFWLWPPRAVRTWRR